MGGVSKYESYQPTTWPWSVVASVASVVCVFIAFVSPTWLINVQDYGDSPFLNIGLWQACFFEFGDVKHLHDRVYDGCYWVLEEEMHVIDFMMQRPFYKFVQSFYTITFILSMFSLMYTIAHSFSEDFSKGLLKLSFITHGASALIGGMAVLTFAVLGDARDWMPHWEYNYLHWGFAFSCAGVVLEIVAAVLYGIEWRIQKRADGFHSTHGMFPDDTHV